LSSGIEGKVHEKMSTEDIRKLCLKALREKNPEWENRWQVYDEAVKKRKR